MKRLALWAVVAGFALTAGSAVADRSWEVEHSVRTSLRGYVGATPQQYDTLEVNEGFRCEVLSFQMYADDSAQTPTLTAWFVSSNSKTPYYKFTESYTANQVKTTLYQGPFTFPEDSTILIYYNITGATPGTLDTLITNTIYRCETGD